MLERLTRLALDYPKMVIGVMLAVTLLFGLQFPKIHIDTDPENMLEATQPDRVFYDQVKRDFGIHELLVVGVVDPQGVFRPEALERVAKATSDILKIEGVILEDVVSLTTTDHVTSAGGVLEVHPAMQEVPQTTAGLERLRQEIADYSFLHEKIASADGTALSIYVPIRRKDMSFRIARQIETILKRELLPGQTYHLAGLPVAEDTFGHEMFVQMAIVAPLAFLGILVIVFLLFRRLAFLLPVGLDAMGSVLWAMGLLIGTGNTVHIMSSMIPVFLMPIAITDDIHIISGFVDRYREVRDKRRALLEAMAPIYRPMLMTSVTTAIGFASLALAAIPPVRVFGLFVAFGVMAAWLFSMTVVPAVISLMPDTQLRRALAQAGADHPSRLDRVLRPMGEFAFSRARTVLVLGLVVLAVGIAGVLRIRGNDNPVRWFKASHRIRVADATMNRLFGGTYMAYVVAEGPEP